MPAKMVGTYRHRDAHGTSHDGIHDYNGFCDIEPRCQRYAEPPVKLMEANTDPAESGGYHSRDWHEWIPDCDDGPPCQPKVLPEPTFAVYDDPPSHYDGGAIQPWDVIDAFGLDYYLGNVLKYTCRAGKKEGETRLKDLKKIRNFINRAIEMEEKK